MPHDETQNMSLDAYPMTASRVFDTPLLIAQPKLDVLLGVLSNRIGFQAQAAEATENDPFASAKQSMVVSEAKAMGLGVERADDGYFIVGERTAVVPVIGTLVHRGGWMEAMSGIQSYQRTQRALAGALADRHVERIVMEYDTPGGEVPGAFDFADYVFEARKHKHITAVVNEMAASGGYLLASAAHEIVVPRTGRVGSIGVVFAHIDRSKALDKAGTAVTFIYAGDKKIDGNPTQPLPERVKAELQGEIDSAYELFVETVARNTGLSTKAIRETQAGMYTGRKAVDAGLAKRVNTFSNELQLSVSRSTGRAVSTSLNQESSMSAAKESASEVPITAAQVDAARAEGKNEGIKAGATAERERIKTITTHADAAGRAEMANHLAFETDMAADAAVALLGKSPKVAAGESGKSALEKAMAAAGNTGISADVPGDKTEIVAPTISVDSIFEARRKAAGH
jgi:signal peptide peptidase SppA